MYECNEGYYLTDGDLVRNCTTWGKWSGKHPVCSSNLLNFYSIVSATQHTWQLWAFLAVHCWITYPIPFSLNVNSNQSQNQHSAKSFYPIHRYLSLSVKKCTAISESPNRSHFPKMTHTYGTVVHFECDDCYKFNSDFQDERYEFFFPSSIFCFGNLKDLIRKFSGFKSTVWSSHNHIKLANFPLNWSTAVLRG